MFTDAPARGDSTHPLQTAQVLQEGNPLQPHPYKRCPSILQTFSRACFALVETVQSTALFLIHFCRAPSQVGSILPSSGSLARAIVVKALPPTTQKLPRRILEIGPGTGAITAEIVKTLREGDHFDLVEFDSAFANTLTQRYRGDLRIHIHQADFIQWWQQHTKQADYKSFDVIISGLPLNIFSVQQVKDSLNGLKQLTAPSTTITYFEYPGLVSIKMLYFKAMHNQSACQKVLDIKQAKEIFRSTMQCSESLVYWNFPPARIVHCKPEGSYLVHT